MRERILDLLGLGEEKEAQPEPKKVSQKVDQATEVGESQPVQPSELQAEACAHPLVVEIGGGGKRCQVCGHQENPSQPVGVSRRDYLNGVYLGTKPTLNSAAFQRARARLLGR